MRLFQKILKKSLTRPIPDRRPQPTEETANNQPTAGVINMISKRLDPGMTAGGESTKKLCQDDVITFIDEDARRIQTPHDDAVVVSTTIANYDVRRIFVDNESSTNILFYLTFSRMRLSADRLKRVSTPMVGFAGDAVTVEGEVTLPMIAGKIGRAHV